MVTTLYYGLRTLYQTPEHVRKMLIFPIERVQFPCKVRFSDSRLSHLPPNKMTKFWTESKAGRLFKVRCFTLFTYIRPSLKQVSDQLFVTLYTLLITPSVHKQLIRTLFEAHIVGAFYDYELCLKKIANDVWLWKTLYVTYRSRQCSRQIAQKYWGL